MKSQLRAIAVAAAMLGHSATNLLGEPAALSAAGAQHAVQLDQLLPRRQSGCEMGK